MAKMCRRIGFFVALLILSHCKKDEQNNASAPAPRPISEVARIAFSSSEFEWVLADKRAIAHVEGEGFKIFSLENQANPIRLGSLNEVDSVDRMVEVQSDIVYVFNRTEGALVLDLKDPTQPKLSESPIAFHITDRVTQALVSHDAALKEDTLYVLGEFDGLAAFDVRKPLAPRKLDVVAPRQPMLVNDLVLADQMAFASAYLDGLAVYDAKDQRKLVRIAQLEIEGKMMRIAVEGGYAYVASLEGGLQVIDVRKPRELKQVGVLQTDELLRDLVVAKGKAVLLTGNDDERFTLSLVDLSEPTRPKLLFQESFDGKARRLATHGTMIDVLDAKNGWTIFNVEGWK